MKQGVQPPQKLSDETEKRAKKQKMFLSAW